MESERLVVRYPASADVREARSKCKPTEHSFPRVVLKLFDDAQLGAVGVGPGYGAPLLRVLF